MTETHGQQQRRGPRANHKTPQLRDVYQATAETCATGLALVETAGVGQSVARVRAVDGLRSDDPRFVPSTADPRHLTLVSPDVHQCSAQVGAHLSNLVLTSAPTPIFKPGDTSPSLKPLRFATLKLKLGVNGGSKFVVNRHGRGDVMEAQLVSLNKQLGVAEEPIARSTYVTANAADKITNETFRVKLFMTEVPKATKGELPTFSVKVDRSAPQVRWSRPHAGIDARVSLDAWTSLAEPERQLAMEVLAAYKILLADRGAVLPSFADDGSKKFTLRNLREIESREYLLAGAAGCSVEFCKVSAMRDASDDGKSSSGPVGSDTEIFIRCHQADALVTAALRQALESRTPGTPVVNEKFAAPLISAVVHAVDTVFDGLEKLDAPRPLLRAHCRVAPPPIESKREGPTASPDDFDAAAFAAHRRRFSLERPHADDRSVAARLRNILSRPAFPGESYREIPRTSDLTPSRLAFRKTPRFHLRRIVAFGEHGFGAIVALPGRQGAAVLAVPTTVMQQAIGASSAEGTISAAHLDSTPVFTDGADVTMLSLASDDEACGISFLRTGNAGAMFTTEAAEAAPLPTLPCQVVVPAFASANAAQQGEAVTSITATMSGTTVVELAAFMQPPSNAKRRAEPLQPGRFDMFAVDTLKFGVGLPVLGVGSGAVFAVTLNQAPLQLRSPTTSTTLIPVAPLDAAIRSLTSQPSKWTSRVLRAAATRK